MLGFVPEEPGLADVIAEQRELLSQLRAVAEAKDTENAVLRQELDAERELRRRLELRLADPERQLSMDSSDSGTPTSKERIGAREARRARQQSERERRPSPATGTPSPPSPAGATSGATSTPPPPTASPHSTPSATHSPENPGYRHCPPSADTNSRHPREWTQSRGYSG